MSTVAVKRRRRLDLDAQLRVRGHLHLVNALARRHFDQCCRTVPLDELIGEAQLALTYAASLYDAERDVPFGAYVTLVIRHHLLQAITVWRRHGRLAHVRFTDVSSVGEAGESEDFDPPCTHTVAADQQVAACELLNQIRRVLPPRWFEVLTLYFANGHTLDEIGCRMGISRERVRQLVGKAIARVRSHFPEEIRGA